MLQNLRDSKYKALILDTPAAQSLVNKDSYCDLFVVGDTFEHFDIAVAFSADMPDSMISSLSYSIVTLQVSDCGCLVDLALLMLSCVKESPCLVLYAKGICGAMVGWLLVQCGQIVPVHVICQTITR